MYFSPPFSFPLVLVCSNGNNLHSILWLGLTYHFISHQPPQGEGLGLHVVHVMSM